MLEYLKKDDYNEIDISQSTFQKLLKISKYNEGFYIKVYVTLILITFIIISTLPYYSTFLVYNTKIKLKESNIKNTNEYDIVNDLHLEIQSNNNIKINEKYLKNCFIKGKNLGIYTFIGRFFGSAIVIFYINSLLSKSNLILLLIVSMLSQFLLYILSEDYDLVREKYNILGNQIELENMLFTSSQNCKYLITSVIVSNISYCLIQRLIVILINEFCNLTKGNKNLIVILFYLRHISGIITVLNFILFDFSLKQQFFVMSIILGLLAIFNSLLLTENIGFLFYNKLNTKLINELKFVSHVNCTQKSFNEYLLRIMPIELTAHEMLVGNNNEYRSKLITSIKSTENIMYYEKYNSDQQPVNLDFLNSTISSFNSLTKDSKLSYSSYFHNKNDSSSSEDDDYNSNHIPKQSKEFTKEKFEEKFLDTKKEINTQAFFYNSFEHLGSNNNYPLNDSTKELRSPENKFEKNKIFFTIYRTFKNKELRNILILSTLFHLSFQGLYFWIQIMLGLYHISLNHILIIYISEFILSSIPFISIKETKKIISIEKFLFIIIALNMCSLVVLIYFIEMNMYIFIPALVLRCNLSIYNMLYNVYLNDNIPKESIIKSLNTSKITSRFCLIFVSFLYSDRIISLFVYLLLFISTLGLLFYYSSNKSFI